MTQMPSSAAPGGRRPHRGVMILVFGILGIVCCVIFGIVAWVMGNSDLQAMQRGEMDPDGEGMTKAGKICGMIGVALFFVAIVVQVIAMVMGLGFGLAGMGQTGGAGP